jgi:hypothetical protein
MLLRRPASLRFETESFFDQPLSILVTNGMEFSVWDMDRGRFVAGSATPANISRVIPIPMDGPEVVGILMGDAPLIPWANAELKHEEDSGLYRLILSNSRLRQDILVHPGSLRPVTVTCRQNDKLSYRIEYEDWLGKKDEPLAPEKILFEMPSEDIRLKLKVKKGKRNPGMKDEFFQLNPPEGIVVESLDPPGGG